MALIMNDPVIIGQKNESINYLDRPTVKAVVQDGDQVLILNNGLLPGGGVDQGESNPDAVTRELQEEVGIAVTNLTEIGTVVQYRDFLQKRYVVNGYTATFSTTNGATSPQDQGEASFTKTWMDIDSALSAVLQAIEAAKDGPINSDAGQGRLYNLMTTRELLKCVILKNELKKDFDGKTP